MLWSISTYISANISSIVLILLFLTYFAVWNKGKRLPKGPYGLPLIGYLPFLGKNPQRTLWKLTEKYGSVYTLPLGDKKIVVLNDWETVRNALRKESFLGRPEITVFSLLTDDKSLIDENEPDWRESRRFFEYLFKISFESPNMLGNLMNELRSFIVFLRKSNEKDITIRRDTIKYINNFFYTFIFGRHYISTKSLFDSAFFLKITILSLYPLWLAKPFYKVLDILYHYHFALFAKFFRNETKNHYKSMKSKDTSIRDLIDYYILEMKAKKATYTVNTMTIDKLRANCQVFLSFGNEAFLSSLEWSLISLAYFSNYQRLIYEEIVKVVGLQNIPNFNDQHKMPFTIAFLNEVLRWKTVLPFSLTRRSLDDATILGHFIPKDTLVMANIWAVHHDPLIWKNPFRFDPYRFLSEDGKTVIDHDGFIPFSLGRRSCVAETFVKKWLFIYIVVILQRFYIGCNSGEEAFDEEFQITIRPKKEVCLSFKLRNSPTIEQR